MEILRKSQKETREIKTTVENWVPLLAHQETVARGQGETQRAWRHTSENLPDWNAERRKKEREIAHPVTVGQFPKI